MAHTMNRSERRFNRKMFGHMVFKDVESARNFLIEKKVTAFLKGAERIEDEIGDLLFAVVNLARKLDIDPEQALRGGSRKFERRFRQVETQLAAKDKAPGSATLDEMESEWTNAKRAEKNVGD